MRVEIKRGSGGVGYEVAALPLFYGVEVVTCGWHVLLTFYPALLNRVHIRNFFKIFYARMLSWQFLRATF